MIMRCNRSCDFEDVACVDDDWANIDDDETVCDSDDGLTPDEVELYNLEQRAMSALREAIRKIYRGNALQKYLKPIEYQS